MPNVPALRITYPLHLRDFPRKLFDNALELVTLGFSGSLIINTIWEKSFDVSNAHNDFVLWDILRSVI